MSSSDVLPSGRARATPADLSASSPGAVRLPGEVVAAMPGLDAFGRRAGADVAIGLLRIYASFDVDPETQEVRVTVFDQYGRVLRRIPPATVMEMINAIAAYRRGA